MNYQRENLLIEDLCQEASKLLNIREEEAAPKVKLLMSPDHHRSLSMMELKEQTTEQIYNGLIIKIKKDLQDSYLFKRKKLKKIIDMCAPDDDAIMEDMGPDLCMKAFAVAIKAIDISNKMEGHYPRESAELRPLRSDEDLERTRNLADRLVIEHKSEY